jgi:hypothetical protein
MGTCVVTNCGSTSNKGVRLDQLCAGCTSDGIHFNNVGDKNLVDNYNDCLKSLSVTAEACLAQHGSRKGSHYCGGFLSEISIVWPVTMAGLGCGYL